MNISSEITKYPIYPFVRMIVSSIPIVGPRLDIVLSEAWNSIWTSRMEQFCSELKVQLDAIDEKKVDRDFLESEEFLDIILRIISDALQSRCGEKRTAYARIIKDCCIHSKSVDKLESAIECIMGLKEKDIQYLKFFNEYYKSNTFCTPEQAHKMLSSENTTLELDEVIFIMYRFSNMYVLEYPRNIMSMPQSVKFSPTKIFDQLVEYFW